jgi:hypothetical protein
LPDSAVLRNVWTTPVRHVHSPESIPGEHYPSNLSGCPDDPGICLGVTEIRHFEQVQRTKHGTRGP